MKDASYRTLQTEASDANAIIIKYSEVKEQIENAVTARPRQMCMQCMQCILC